MNPEIPPADCGEYMARIEWRFAGTDPVLESIRGRCVIDDETGCWHWSGAMSRARRDEAVPVMVYAGRTTSVPRVSYAHSGRRLQSGGIVWRDCRCKDCVNPDHLLYGTRALWGAWRKRTGSAKFTPDQLVANMVRTRNRKTAVLSVELASYIRTSEATGRAVAAELGVSASTVSRVRRGEAWAEGTQGASVFSWRP